MTDNGQKIKLRWYHDDPECFGKSLWDSPYAREGYPWLFAAQQSGDAANLVGALPLVDPRMLWNIITEDDDVPTPFPYPDLDDTRSFAEAMAREFEELDKYDLQQEKSERLPPYSGANVLDQLIADAEK